MDGIVFWRENCAPAPVSFDHVSYSVFGIARDLFYWELIFCVFVVPKERALKEVSLSDHTLTLGFIPFNFFPSNFSATKSEEFSTSYHRRLQLEGHGSSLQYESFFTWHFDFKDIFLGAGTKQY